MRQYPLRSGLGFQSRVYCEGLINIAKCPIQSVVRWSTTEAAIDMSAAVSGELAKAKVERERAVLEAELERPERFPVSQRERGLTLRH